MNDAPTLNGRILGEAERATRAVLDRLLEETGTTFYQWVALNALAMNGGAIAPDELVRRMVFGLKIDAEVAGAAQAELLEQGLATPSSRKPGALELTGEGRERHDRIRAGIEQISERLYGDVPVEDLRVTGRVLTLLTERANAELAAAI